ncbi:NAD(+)/NADH kinase [Microbacteriaceae bacterium VKM Ac-2854]|nr:NAD(+)/NADH kinase [Microbacteriaceae bacterium VKM Ac-2854]
MEQTAETRTKRAAVIYNPIKVDALRLHTLVADAAETALWADSLWFETTVEQAGQQQAREAVAQGADVVLAVGGDGTVRAVAEGLSDSGVPLALVPLGTGNLLARNLDLGLGFEDAIRTAFTGGVRTIDVGRADIRRADGSHEEHVFLVMAGLGIDAKMIAKTNAKLKKAVGWLAYVDGGMRALAELKPIKLRFSLDGQPERSATAHSVMLGNCGVLPGGILLIPDARPDDGLLDIVALRPRGAFGWLKVWNTITFENGVLRKSAAGRKLIDLQQDARDVIYVKGRDFRIRMEEPQEFQLDGDEFGEAIAVHGWVDPGALRVKVPR